MTGSKPGGRNGGQVNIAGWEKQGGGPVKMLDS